MARTMLSVRLLLMSAFLLFASSFALGQYGASLEGTVTDNSGAVISGAAVTATDQATGVSHSAVTGESGFYRITGLPPGLYRVDVEAASFKKTSRSDIPVGSEAASAANVTMQSGSASETVTVTSDVSSLQTEDANVQGTISSVEVANLPEINRDPYELLRLAPGVFGDGARLGDGRSSGFPNGAGGNGGSAGPGGSSAAIFQVENQQPISANGMRVTSNDYLVDGVGVNSLQWGGAAVITPSIEAVQEITVLSNDYDASDGRSSGAHIKTVTKSGTNAFHGGGVFLYHNPNFNAFNKFGGYTTGVGQQPSVRDEDAFRQFAGTLGGPIVKNKIFFFFNYEGLRARNTTFENNWVETSQIDNLILADRPGTPVATILQQRGLAPRIKQILPADCTLWIQATQPCAVVAGGIDIGSPGGTYGTYNPSFTAGDPAQYVGGGLDGNPDLQFAQIFLPAVTSGNQYNARVDYNSGKNLFSVNTFLTFYNTVSADAQAQGRPMADFGTKNFSPSGFLSWVRTINSTTLNEARFNFTRYAYNGITSNPQVNFAIPRIEIQGLPLPAAQRIRYGAPQGDTSPGILAQNTYAFRDVLSKVIGNKALKFGFEYTHAQDNDALIGGARPDQVFQGLWNFANGTPIFEQIEVNPLTGAAPTTRGQYYRSSIYSGFVQNDWKVRPNLTVNIGLRWEYYAPPTEAKGHLTNFVPTRDPSTGLLNGVEINPKQQWNPTWRNFGPRLGFAWSPTMYGNKVVFRGGFGIAYDRFDDNVFDQTRNNPPFVANYGICCGTEATGFGTPFVNGQIAFNLGTSNNPQSYPANPALITPLAANGLPVILKGQSPPNIYANPTYMPIPYTYLYSFQVQNSLAKDLVFTLGYQGSVGHHLTRIKNLAEFYPTPNPNVNQVFSFTPDTNSSFNALNAQLEHRFRHGVSANILYTWSKSFDQLSAEGPGFTTNQTYPIDDRTERGPSDYDATHNFRAYAVWDLPNFSRDHSILAKVVGGWQLNGIYQFHSGFPWTPVANNICPVLGATSLCPLRPIAYNGNAGNNHDTSAFLPPISGNFPLAASAAAAGTQNPYFTLQTTGTSPDFPGIGRNSFRGPRYQDIDLTIAKEFGLPTMKFFGERAKIQLRMTAYNVFDKLNLAPFTFGSASTVVSYFNNNSGIPVANPLFGTATAGLAGRVLELQGRFSF